MFVFDNQLSNYYFFSYESHHNFFLQVIQFMEIDNREHLINSLLNELRYPSNQTLYFLLLINYILVRIHNDEIEEHIIMLLFERCLIKPIPWGVELLFKKLIKGKSYNLFNKSFIVNLNGGINFIKSINDFIDDKTCPKYTLFRNIRMNNNNIPSSTKDNNKKEKTDQNKKSKEMDGDAKNKNEENH